MKKFGFAIIVALLLLVGGIQYVSSEQLSHRISYGTKRIGELQNLSSGESAKKKAEKKPGFLFELGIGIADISYGTEVDTSLSSASLYGVQRVELTMNVDLGWYIWDNSYLLLSLFGIGDRLEDNYGSYIQLNTYLLGPGVKLYPFGKGLALGVTGGFSRMVVVSNVGVGGSSPLGYGLRLFAAYDLMNKPTGFGLDIGVSGAYMFIEEANVSAASLFVDLVWK